MLLNFQHNISKNKFSANILKNIAFSLFCSANGMNAKNRGISHKIAKTANPK